MEDNLTPGQQASLQKYRDRVLQGGPRRQWIGRSLVRLVGLVLIRIKVEGKVPRGAMVIASNHSGVLDFFALERLQRWKNPRGIVMGKAGMFSKLWSGELVSSVGAFPVVRGGADQAALRTAEIALQNGACLTIFPEGSWFPDGKLRPFKQGAARVALQAGVPVLPVYLQGADRHWRALIPKRVKIRVIVGDLIEPQGSPERLTERMHGAVLGLQASLSA